MDIESGHVDPNTGQTGQGRRVDVEMPGNSHANDEKRMALTPNRVTFLERIDHFTWAWYTLTMSTGGIALLLSVQPHTFKGLDTIGKVVFILDLVLFILLTTAIAIRFARTPSRLPASIHHPTEGLFFPTFLLSISTILGGMQRYGVPSTGVWLTVTLRVLFWMYVAVTFLSSILQYWVLFTGRQLTVQSMTPSWLLPIFPVMLCGTVATLISPSQPEDQRTAILVAGVTFQGLGFWVAILVYAVYISRLMEFGLPGPNLRPGMFIAVGPPSFTALALIGMSRSIPAGYGYFAAHPEVVSMLQQLALAFGIFIWSLSFWFFSVTLLSIVLIIPHMSFHLAWWALVFPNVGFTIAIIEIGQGLQSNAITWLGSIMTILLVAVYLFVLGAHIKAVVAKEIMWPGKDEDKEV